MGDYDAGCCRVCSEYCVGVCWWLQGWWLNCMVGLDASSLCGFGV